MAELYESILLAFLAEHPCSTIDEIMAGLSYLPLQKVDFLKLIRHLIGDTIERVDRDGKVMFKLK